MSKKNHKTKEVFTSKFCYYFRDRKGNRFGPYYEIGEIKNILKNHKVDEYFKPENTWLSGKTPATEFVMEDIEYNSICPQKWLDAQKAVQRQQYIFKNLNSYGNYIYRKGSVDGIHKPRYLKMYRTPNFGRKVHDTGHGCVEDNEPPIRTKLTVASGYAWDDFENNYARKSWKNYRKHQWRNN